MQNLVASDLMTLEQYAAARSAFRARAMAHKRDRKVPIGPHATLYFEDWLTMQYQVQEMLRIEGTSAPEGIADELAVYNPMIPDGTNWKATLMLEYADISERRAALERMIGIEDCVWVQVAGNARVRAIADEDLERTRAGKTSAVHFLRFELTPEMIVAVKAGADVAMGIGHEAYRVSVDAVPRNVLQSLVADLL